MTLDQAIYPTRMPTPVRLSNGDVLTQAGGVLPFAASCPPDTTPDRATLTCSPFPGARNINYECGGVLVPPGAAGCAAGQPRRTQDYPVDAIELAGVQPPWPGCFCSTYPPSDEGRADGDGNVTGESAPRSNAPAAFACFVLALAVGAALLRRNG